MCGIAGAFALDGRTVAPLDDAAMQRMLSVIQHRGPDDSGLVQLPGASLGARRLSIIDVAGGHQPFPGSSDGVWGAQNGEIYNHDALRDELCGRGHAFRSRCDTEVLPHLYEEHGPALCERLHGKFAIGVWDGRHQRGVLARDRLGVKPLYFAEVGGLIVFASELKAVIASGLVSDTLDLEALAAYLTLGFVPGPMTPLRDVRKLMPGERLIVDAGVARLERYWRYPAPAPDPGPSTEEWDEQVLTTLDEAVRRRLMSDVPLGAMLSGGLDSSLIVALMARHSSRPVKTFAIGLAGAGSDSELDDARRVAEALGTEHHELELPMATGRDAVERLGWHLDEPVRSLSALGFLALSELAASEVTVALAGQGADELFGGYRKHRVMSLAASWRRIPGGLRRPVTALAQHGPGEIPRLATALQSPDAVTRLIASSGLLRPDLQGDLFGGALAEHADAARRAASRYAAPVSTATPLAAGLYLDGQLGLVDDMLHYFDRVSMAHSLEVRVPFLDHELVELSARMPDSLKVHRGETKRVLRSIARGVVPEFVLTKRKQGFFRDSVGPWLAADDGAIVDDTLLHGERCYAAIVEPRVVEQIVRDWRAGAGEHAQFLLAMVQLEVWLSSTMPRAFAIARGAASAV